MAKYLSNKFKSLKIGLDEFSENKTSLTIIGNVGIGETLSLNSVTGIITAVSFKRHGGASSEFLMADGSTNNSTFLTAESDTLDSILTRGNTTTKNLTVGDITADNISVGGTITYDDVTSVDSLGIVTARSGIYVGPINAGVATITADGNATFSGIITSANLNVSGVSTFAGITTVTGDTLFTKQLNVSGVSTFNNNVNVTGATTRKISVGIGNTITEFNPFGFRVFHPSSSGIFYQNDNDPLVSLNSGNVKIDTSHPSKSFSVEYSGTQSLFNTQDRTLFNFSANTATGQFTVNSVAAGGGEELKIVKNLTTIRKDLILGGNAGIGSLNVTGVSTFIGLSTFANGIQVVSGTAVFDGNIDANGSMDIESDLTVNGLLYTGLNSQIIVDPSGGIDCNGFLDVEGTSTFRDNITVSNAAPKIFLTDSNDTPDFEVGNFNGGFRIRDTTNNEDRLTIDENGHADIGGNLAVGSALTVTANINTSNSLIVAGSVGIGTNTPQVKLHVSGDSAETSHLPTFAAATRFVVSDTINPSSFNAISILGGVNGAAFVKFGDKNDENAGEIGYYNSDDSMRFYTNGSTTEKLHITSAGEVGIGTVNPQGTLQVGTGVTVYGNAGIVSATKFIGDGSGLTDLPADQLTGNLPAVSGANLTDVITTSGGNVGDLSVSGIASVGIGTTGDTFTGKVDLFHEGEVKLRTTPAGVQVVGILSATSLDFTGAEGAFSDDLLLQGGSANALWDRSESYLQFNDGAKAVFGTDVSSGDLEIYHSGSHSYINEDGVGQLLITTGIGTTAAMVSDGSITLYYQGTERLKTTSTGITLTGTLTADIEGNATTATKATDLAINATQQLLIQTGNDATDVFDSGTVGYVLQSNGSGLAPSWSATAPANAITGITIREDGLVVGSANSVSTINFTGAGVGVTFTNPVAGIATVTIAGGGGGDSSAVMLSMIFG